MHPDLWTLYSLMLKSRLLEIGIAVFWHDGLISGEMHLGTGEEAVIAGIVSQLTDGDGMALDHRGTAALVMRGLDPVPVVRELLGYPDGLCGGMGGHMHLFSREYLAASSGIVGASGPVAAGFGIWAQYAKPGAIAVAFFGEGSMNQGMLMESMNLASVWKLPVLFVCKNDGWSITTRSAEMTGGSLNVRARGLGMPAFDINGFDVADVWQTARTAIARARAGEGPSFLNAGCTHFEGHFLGYQILRILREPVKELPAISIPLSKSFLKPKGAGLSERMKGVKQVLTALLSTLRNPHQDTARDPVFHARATLLSEPARLEKLEEEIEKEVRQTLADALKEVPS